MFQKDDAFEAGEQAARGDLLDMDATEDHWVSDVRSRFDIPEGEGLLKSYACAQRGSRGFLWQGIMHIFEQHLVFHSNVFGFVHSLVLHLQDIKALLPRSYMKLPTAIKVVCLQGGEERVLLFASFLNRGAVLHLLQEQQQKVKECLAADEGELYKSNSRELLPDAKFVEPFITVLNRMRRKRLDPAGVLAHWKDLVKKNRIEGTSPVLESLSSIDDDYPLQHGEADGQEMGGDSPLELSDKEALPNVWIPQPGTIPAPGPEWKLLHTEVDMPGNTKDFFRYILSDDTNFLLRWWDLKKFRMQQILAWAPNTVSSIRQVQFVTPLQENFGPKETLCIQDHCLLVWEDGSLSFDVFQTMPQLPVVGGCFNVCSSFRVTDSGMKLGKPTLTVKMYFKIVWLSSGIVVNRWKDSINSKTEAELRTQWPVMAGLMRDYLSNVAEKAEAIKARQQGSIRALSETISARSFPADSLSRASTLSSAELSSEIDHLNLFKLPACSNEADKTTTAPAIPTPQKVQHVHQEVGKSENTCKLGLSEASTSRQTSGFEQEVVHATRHAHLPPEGHQRGAASTLAQDATREGELGPLLGQVSSGLWLQCLRQPLWLVVLLLLWANMWLLSGLTKQQHSMAELMQAITAQLTTTQAACHCDAKLRS